MARPVISLLGAHEWLSVSNFTIALATAMVLGAGTDYGIFLLANYHEGGAAASTSPRRWPAPGPGPRRSSSPRR